MTLDIHPTADDLIKWSKQLSTTLQKPRRYRLMSIIFWGCVGSALFFISDSYPTIGSRFIVGFLSAMLLIIPYFFFVQNQFWKQLHDMISQGKSAHALGKQRLPMTKEGIHEYNEECERNCTWSCVDSIEHTQKFFFEFTSLVAVIIPKRTFDDPQKAQEFLAEITKFKEAGHSATT